MIRTAATALCIAWALAAPAAEVRLDAASAGKDVQDALRASSLTLAEAAKKDPTPLDLLAAAKADYSRLVGVLYAQGYYSPVIQIRVDGREAAGIPPYETPDRIGTITLSVTPGPQFMFSQARVAPLAPGTTLPEDFATGRIARSTVIQQAAEAGVEGWRDVGHAKARVTDQTITADHRANTLAADITLTPGARLTFGGLVITGKSDVRPERIRAIAGLPSGKTFSPKVLERAATRLRRTGTFRSVALSEAETPNPDGSLDITAALLDEKKHRIGAGVELSTTEGLKLSAYWLHRNLLRGAERFRLDGEVSGIGGTSGGVDFKLGASLTRPATFNPDTSLGLSAA
ncbi:MAG: POTRA domain-containing protein, partial [Paracoccaceae bacterium]